MTKQTINRRRFVQAAGALGLAGGVTSLVGGEAMAAPKRKTGGPLFRLPPQCVDQVPQEPEDYQAVFDYRRGGWAGGDGAWPVSLPDGRILWLFGDTFIGEIDENNYLLPGWTMVRSAQEQSKNGKCFTPLIRGTRTEPRSFLPDHEGAVFWAAGGYVDTNVKGGVVRIPATGVCTDEDGWYVCRVSIHTLSLPDLSVTSIDPAPYDPTTPDIPSFGQKMFHDGDTLYLYGYAGGFQRGGPNPDGQYARGMYAARAAASNPTGAWQYWTGPDQDAWSDDVGQAKPMLFDPVDDPRYRAMAGIIRWGEGYIMTGKNGYLWVYGPEMYAWTAPTPAGPWSQVRVDEEPVNLVPDVTFPEPRLHYGGQMVTNVPGSAPDNPLLVFSTNGATGDESVMVYGPHFVRPVGLPAA